MNTASAAIRGRSLRIASVYAPSPLNQHWLALQDTFLRRCPPDVDLAFGIFLNGTEIDITGTCASIIGHAPHNIGHAAGLQRLLDHFRGPWRGSDGYLLLDSDCFPVQPHWLAELTDLMTRHRKSFAAPIRYENLEGYPHPCALYFDGAALDDTRLQFDEEATARNLLGDPVRDIGAGLDAIRPDLLPLLRTNVRNLHPIAAAVYSHLFYHHGAGSRRFGFRAINRYGYYAPMQRVAQPAGPDPLMDALLADADAFIDGLMRP